MTDFGLAKLVVGTTATVAGTPEYFAPEIAKGVSYNRSVDWWALGCMLYEMMMGQTPFVTDDIQRLFAKIQLGIKIAKFPQGELPLWGDLVKKLCAEKPGDRLCMRPRGCKNMVEHPFWKTVKFDWKEFGNGKVVPPYVPSGQIVLGKEKPEVPFQEVGGWWTRWDEFNDPWGPRTLN